MQCVSRMLAHPLHGEALLLSLLQCSGWGGLTLPDTTEAAVDDDWEDWRGGGGGAGREETGCALPQAILWLWGPRATPAGLHWMPQGSGASSFPPGHPSAFSLLSHLNALHGTVCGTGGQVQVGNS